MTRARLCTVRYTIVRNVRTVRGMYCLNKSIEIFLLGVSNNVNILNKRNKEEGLGSADFPTPLSNIAPLKVRRRPSCEILF